MAQWGALQVLVELASEAGETVELVARIRQDAVTRDFASIKDPLDEALRTRFIYLFNQQ